MTCAWTVVPLQALADNYIFLLVAGDRESVALVDPGEARPVLDLLERERWRPETILLTHHHEDHVGGVGALVARFPGLRVVGAERDRARLPHLTEGVRGGDVVSTLGREARVIEVPGHTREHIAWFFPDDHDGGDLFCGDTLFGGTIGNLFEGTPDDMFHSLVKLRALPPATRLWCGHEYTLQYVREAARFEPENARLSERLARLSAAGEGATHVPLLLSEERATNPFLRWDDPQLTAKLGTTAGVGTFRRLCEVA